MIPRYGFNKCLISELSFLFKRNTIIAFLGKTLLKERGDKVPFSKKDKAEEIECVRFIKKADVTFLLRNKNVTS